MASLSTSEADVVVKGPGAGRTGRRWPMDRRRPVLSLTMDAFSYGREQVLGHIDLNLRPGETVAITGPSGIGKTTLLRILCGLEKGCDCQRSAPERISMVFQEPTLLPWRSAVDNLRLTTGIGKQEALSALGEVGLEGKGDMFPDQLSLGQQRRLALARAFAGEPQVLFLDEPFVSLDPATADEMMTLFARLRAHRALASVLVTHNKEEAERLSTRILKLGGHPAQVVGDRENRGDYFQVPPSEEG